MKNCSDNVYLLPPLKRTVDYPLIKHRNVEESAMIPSSATTYVEQHHTTLLISIQTVGHVYFSARMLPYQGLLRARKHTHTHTHTTVVVGETAADGPLS